MSDADSEIIYKVLKLTKEPLETKELQVKATDLAGKEITRSKLLYRLNNLRAEGRIRGKSVGPSKGVWIWWSDSHSEKK